MDLLFLICAIFGGTVLVAQFLLGFGGDDVDAEGAEDAPDHVDGADDNEHADVHGSTWMFGVLSFRTVMIGLTFFGLTGKAASASQFEEPWPLIVAVACGVGAMYGVFFLMRGLYRLTADGTERIARSVGAEGMVYLTIPGGNSGVGKIHVTVQNRLVEYEAMTAGEKLPTGSRVVVVEVLNSDCVAVEAAAEPVRNSHV